MTPIADHSCILRKMSFTGVASVLCVVLACLVKTSTSCKGYSLKVNNIKNCGSDNVVKVENFDLTLDEECNIVPKGCATVTKDFRTAQAHITFNKPPLPQINGNADLCKLAGESKSVAQILTDLAFPNKCPVAAGRICADGTKKHNIGRIRNQLGMLAGNISLKTEIEHDSGTTCIDINATVRRN